MAKVMPGLLLVLMFLLAACDNSAENDKGGQVGAPSRLPVPDTVTMVDLGAKECVPCKMMAPILVELEEEYRGRAAVVFIDVWENPEKARDFNIKTIPTQIFYDRQGQERYRHVGFLDKESIATQLDQLLDQS
ncbi:MAG: thioredoxin family protein [Desulfurivibrio sp.]|nr:thioredoxin family protein [Desulfurivibrio sp.]